MSSSALRVVRRRLHQGAILAGSVLAFLPAYIAARLVTVNPVVAILAAGVLITAPGLVLAWLRFTPAGREAVEVGRNGDLVGSVSIWCWLTATSTSGFTALSAGLYDLGVGSLKGHLAQGTDLSAVAFESYLWHLADAVPVLKIPETLNWSLQNPFSDSIQGSLLLAYKCLVLVPAIYLGGQVLARWMSDKRAVNEKS
ncbi:MAG: hypothetical protein JWR42_2944 [Marmoricola sp.]|nr:hypothetical protein [Marmoricola sp.]